MVQYTDIGLAVDGRLTRFSVDIIEDGIYRLQVNVGEIRLTIDMSQSQFDALGAAHNDADGQVRGFVGQEFGDE